VEAPSEAEAVAAAVLSALRALASRQPVLVAIDDFPWLDRASADAVAFAARRLRDDRVRFLLTRRSRAPSAPRRALRVEHLGVGPLALGAGGRLRAEVSLSRQLVQRIFDTTLGNPLFVAELGRMLSEQGVPASGADLPVPETVEELFGTRVKRLSPSVR